MAVLHHAREDVLSRLDVADLESYDTLVAETLAALKRLPEPPEDASRNQAILEVMQCLREDDETELSYICVASTGQKRVAELLQTFPILSAARNGQTAIVTRILKILKTWPESVRYQAVRTVMTIANKDQAIPLHWAAINGRYAVVEQFLNTMNGLPEAERVAGFAAMVGAVDTLNRTPLSAAFEHGHKEILDQLTKALPLMSAVLGGHNQSVKQFMQALHALPREERCSAIKDALKIARADGATSLYLAASQGNKEIIKLLLGAVSTLLKDGKREEAWEVLYSACRVEEEDGARKITPLGIAARNRCVEAVKLLLEAIRQLFNIKR